MSDTDLKEKELNPGAHDDLGTPQERAEAEAAGLQKQFDNSPGSGNPDGGFDKGNVGQKKKGKLSGRQKGIVGGIAGLLIGGGIAGFGIIQGPLQVIHIAQLLQRFHFSNNESLTDSRAGRIIAYIHSRNTPERRNLNFAGNQVADIYQRKLGRSGIEFDFTTPSGSRIRRITGINIDVDNPNSANMLDSLKARGVDVSSIDIDAGGVQRLQLDIGNSSTDLGRNVVKGVVESLDIGRVSGGLGSRLLIHRARVDFSPLRNRRIERGQDRESYSQAVREEVADEVKEGVDPPDVSDVEPDRPEPDDEGNQPDADPELEEAADGANDAVGDARANGGTPDGLQDTRARFRGLARGAGWVGAGVGVICAARDLGGQVEQIEHANVVLPLIRMGTRTVAMGNQVMSGNNVSLDELGVYINDFYDEETQTAFMGAQSIQAELGQSPTGPDIKPEAKPSQVGQKATLFQVLDNGAFGAVCGVNNFIGNLPGLRELGNLSNAAIEEILGPIGLSPTQLMESLANFFAGGQVNPLASGAELGNLVNYGSRLAANDVAISMGGRTLSNTEVVQLDTERNVELQRLNQSKNLYARYFDLSDMDSVARQMAVNIPTEGSQIVSGSLNAFANFPSLFANVFGNHAGAQESYSYGFEEFGFSSAELDSEVAEDPIENARVVEEEIGIDTLNERYGDCFSMQVDENGNLVNGQAALYQDIEDGDCDGTSEDFIRYRFYILDSVVSHSLMCYEGVTASCNQLGMGGTVGEPEAGGEITEPVVGNTADIPCAPGTTDVGEVDGYNNGQRYTIRLCEIPGFQSRSSDDSNGVVRVNSTVSQNWLNLYLASQNSGVRMVASSSFRDMEKQEYLYNCYQTGSCNGGNTAARPGYSNHQIGMAIDIDIVEGASDPTLVSCQASPSTYPTYAWLASNAVRFGMNAQVEDECWHWSPTGR